MPICIRRKQEFLQFCKLKSLRGVYIASVITEALGTQGLSLANIRGQGYDGASSMSSERCGIQAEIKKHSPLAVYTHCAGH